MKKNNLLFISYDFPPKCRWGIARHVEALSLMMKKYFNVEVATKSENKKSTATIFSSPESDDNFIKSRFLPYDAYVDFEYLMAWNYLFSKKIIFEYKKRGAIPNIIHNHNWMTFPAALNVKKYFNSKLVSSLHFLEKQYLGFQEIPTAIDFDNILRIEQDIMEKSERLIVFGENHKHFVSINYNVSRRKLEVIPHGLDLKQFKNYYIANPVEYNKQLNINFVGRIVVDKGIRELISVVNQLKKEFPFIKLNLIGDGHLKSEISESESINLCGFLSHEKVLEMNKNANIFCLPSYTETFGYAAIEAMACGLPIIMSKGKNVEKLLNQNEALFVEVNNSSPVSINSETLKNHLSLLIKSKEKRKELSKKSLLAAKRYSLNQMIKKTKNVYNEILS